MSVQGTPQRQTYSCGPKVRLRPLILAFSSRLRGYMLVAPYNFSADQMGCPYDAQPQLTGHRHGLTSSADRSAGAVCHDSTQSYYLFTSVLFDARLQTSVNYMTPNPTNIFSARITYGPPRRLWHLACTCPLSLPPPSCREIPLSWRQTVRAVAGRICEKPLWTQLQTQAMASVRSRRVGACREYDQYSRRQVHAHISRCTTRRHKIGCCGRKSSVVRTISSTH